MKIFKVTSYMTGNGYKHYRYFCDGYLWNLKEIREVEGYIGFTFSPNMNQDDRDKVNDKWKHKRLI